MKNKIETLILFLGSWSLHPNCQEFKGVFFFFFFGPLPSTLPPPPKNNILDPIYGSKNSEMFKYISHAKGFEFYFGKN